MRKVKQAPIGTKYNYLTLIEEVEPIWCNKRKEQGLLNKFYDANPDLKLESLKDILDG